MYSNGRGVPQDYKQAVEWYRKAAEQGYEPAQFNLGLMYENGRGVTQDFVQAHKWVNLAATTGDKVAIYSRDELAAKMTTSQIEEAQRLAREWSAKHTKSKP
jgi:TPR repeat protein